MSLPMKSGPVTIGDELIRPPTPVNRRVATLTDRLWQISYFVAYRAARAWWFLRRPKHRGAVVAVWHDGEILVVRTSYRSRWDLPGGGLDVGEDAKMAALRELREEIGLALPADALALAQADEIFWEYRHDHVTVFETILAERPILHLDNREIIAAEFRPPRAIATAEVSVYVARYLAYHDARKATGLTASSAPAASA
jgi:8-oxo-dGTP diphosphatase